MKRTWLSLFVVLSNKLVFIFSPEPGCIWHLLAISDVKFSVWLFLDLPRKSTVTPTRSAPFAWTQHCKAANLELWYFAVLTQHYRTCTCARKISASDINKSNNVKWRMLHPFWWKLWSLACTCGGPHGSNFSHLLIFGAFDVFVTAAVALWRFLGSLHRILVSQLKAVRLLRVGVVLAITLRNFFS